jgi:DNA polymerase-3 subunit epsilon
VELIVFFDTETTGLPKRYGAAATDVENWPRIVQLAWLTTNENGEELGRGNHIIKPDGWHISPEAERVHKISMFMAHDRGVGIKEVLNKFEADIFDASLLVAHNIKFDEKVVGAEFVRAGIRNYMDTAQKFCTMDSTTGFCGLRKKNGTPKWPKLQELHFKLFGEYFEDAHDAMIDVEATAKCFFKLKELTKV